jgi:hypothetical protein
MGAGIGGAGLIGGTMRAKSKYQVVVRGLDGIEDAQVWSTHRTRAAAEREIARSQWSERNNIAARYNARWTVEQR